MTDTPPTPELQAEIDLAIQELRPFVLKLQADGHTNQAIAVVDGEYRWMEREFESALRRASCRAC